jgi:hypothetical protein
LPRLELTLNRTETRTSHSCYYMTRMPACLFARWPPLALRLRPRLPFILVVNTWIALCTQTSSLFILGTHW